MGKERRERVRTVEYQPQSVKETLVEMKDAVDAVVDIALCAVITDDADLAADTLDIEERIDRLHYQGQMSLMLSARNPGEAERLLGLMRAVNATEKLADAAERIAGTVDTGNDLPADLRDEMDADPRFPRPVTVDDDMAGNDIGGMLDADNGIGGVVAVRRAGEYRFAPEDTFTLQEGDTAIVRRNQAAAAPSGGIVGAIGTLNRHRALAVDLGYEAAVREDLALAEEVMDMEMDAEVQKKDILATICRACADLDDPADYAGLFPVVESLADAVDAAMDVADVVVRDLRVHDVMGEALRETRTVVFSITVGSGSDAAGATVSDLQEMEGGIRVRAVRTDEDWLPLPPRDHELTAGDTVILKCPSSSRETIEALFR